MAPFTAVGTFRIFFSFLCGDDVDDLVASPLPLKPWHTDKDKAFVELHDRTAVRASMTE